MTILGPKKTEIIEVPGLFIGVLDAASGLAKDPKQHTVAVTVPPSKLALARSDCLSHGAVGQMHKLKEIQRA